MLNAVVSCPFIFVCKLFAIILNSKFSEILHKQKFSGVWLSIQQILVNRPHTQTMPNDQCALCIKPFKFFSWILKERNTTDFQVRIGTKLSVVSSVYIYVYLNKMPEFRTHRSIISSKVLLLVIINFEISKFPMKFIWSALFFWECDEKTLENMLAINEWTQSDVQRSMHPYALNSNHVLVELRQLLTSNASALHSFLLLAWGECDDDYWWRWFLLNFIQQTKHHIETHAELNSLRIQMPNGWCFAYLFILPLDSVWWTAMHSLVPLNGRFICNRCLCFNQSLNILRENIFLNCAFSNGERDTGWWKEKFRRRNVCGMQVICLSFIVSSVASKTLDFIPWL